MTDDQKPPQQTTRDFISRNPRPGMILCTDPQCSPAFGHPHYHEGVNNPPPHQTTEPAASDYTESEQRLAQGINERAYAEHEASWAKEKWPVFLPHARAAIEALIDMGITLSIVATEEQPHE